MPSSLERRIIMDVFWQRSDEGTSAALEAWRILYPMRRHAIALNRYEGDPSHAECGNRCYRIRAAPRPNRRHQFRLDGAAADGAGRQSLFQVRSRSKPRG